MIMRCEKCKTENNDGSIYCRKCGTPLKRKNLNHANIIPKENNKQDNTIYYLITIIIIQIAIIILLLLH